MVLRKVIKKIKYLKFSMKQHQTKQVLCDDEFKTYLEFLYTNFAIAAFGKTTNNYALVFKKFYFNCLLA